MRAIPALLIAALALPAAAQPLQRFAPRSPAAVPGEYLVEATGGAESLGVEARAVTPGLRLVRLPGAEGLAAGAARIQALPGAGRVEPNFLYRPGLAIGGDPLHDRHWALGPINAVAAWRVFHDASPVVVAVIDTDVNTDHEDLRANLWTNPGEVPGNGIDDDGNGFVDDIHGWDFGDGDPDTQPHPDCSAVEGEASTGEHGHGTHVAGIIGAVGGNGVGTIGIAPRVKVMALKVAPSMFDGVCNSGMPNSAIIAAIDYAIANGAKVMNLSLGGPSRSAFMRMQFEAAAAADVVMVSAAGNDGLDNDPDTPYGVAIRVERDGQTEVIWDSYAPDFPASFDTATQITVGAVMLPEGDRPLRLVDDWWGEGDVWTDRIEGLRYADEGWIDDSAARFVPLGEDAIGIGSNWGARRVHVAAPGFDILSTVTAGGAEGLTSRYALMSGTSMAAPVVAGAVAVLRAAFPEMTAQEVRARLVETSRPAGPIAGRVVSGGVIDLLAALSAPGARRALPDCPAAAGGNPLDGGGMQPLPLAGGADAAADDGIGGTGLGGTGAQGLGSALE